MLYCRKTKLLFIHIPKSAGSSIRESLSLLSAEKDSFQFESSYKAQDFHWHYSLESFINLATEDDSPLAFAIVRNPWDRLWSRWNFLWQQSKYYYTKDGMRKSGVSQVKELGFEHWIYEGQDYVLTAPERWENIVEKSQRSWLVNDQGELRVDLIGKFENLELTLKSIELKYNLQIQVSHLKKTHHSDYRMQFSAKMIDFVSERFKEDIVQFDYSFE